MPLRTSSTIKKYRRKPQAERIPPVEKHVKEITKYEDAIVDMVINNMERERTKYIDIDPFGGHAINFTAPIDSIKIRKSLSYHAKPKSFTMVEQEYVVRWNNTAKKPYARWQTTGVFSAYITSKDRIAYLYYTMNYDQKARRSAMPAWEAPYQLSSFGHIINDNGANVGCMLRFRVLAEKHLGRPVDFDSVYPAREYLGQLGHALFPGSVMRSSTPGELVMELYGKNNYRKDLVKQVAWLEQSHNTIEQKTSALYYTSLFKDLVPTDWIIMALNNIDAYYANMGGEKLDITNIPIWHNILKQLRPAERKNILTRPAGVNTVMHVIDLIRQARNNWERELEINPHPCLKLDPKRKNFKSLEDFHDTIVGNERRRAREQQMKRDAERYKREKMFINYNRQAHDFALALEMDFKSEQGYVIRFARDYETLLDWSDYMSNCIGSYFSTPDVMLAGIYDGERLVANLEIRAVQDYNRPMLIPTIPLQIESGQSYPTSVINNKTVYQYNYKLKQLLGRFNKALDPPIKEPMELILANNGVIIDRDVWH